MKANKFEIMQTLLGLAGIIAMVVGVFWGICQQSPAFAFGLGVGVPVALWIVLIWINL